MAHVVAWTLVVLYAIVVAYMSAQLVVMFRDRHKRTSYKAFFNYFSLLWAFIRGFFWLTFAVNYSPPSLAFSLLFWLPLTVQYLTFALLAVFLAKVVLRRHWSAGGWRRRVFIVYIAVALLSVIGTLASALGANLATKGRDDDDANDEANFWNNLELLLNAILFLFLSCIFLVLAWHLRLLRRDQISRMFLFRPAVLSGVTGTIGVVFISRTVFNFLEYGGLVTVDITKDDAATDVEALAAYLSWEFFPLTLLLATIAGGPQGPRVAAINDAPAPTFGVFGAIARAAMSKASGGAAAGSSSSSGGTGGVGAGVLDGDGELVEGDVDAEGVTVGLLAGSPVPMPMPDAAPFPGDRGGGAGEGGRDSKGAQPPGPARPSARAAEADGAGLGSSGGLLASRPLGGLFGAPAAVGTRGGYGGLSPLLPAYGVSPLTGAGFGGGTPMALPPYRGDAESFDELSGSSPGQAGGAMGSAGGLGRAGGFPFALSLPHMSGGAAGGLMSTPGSGAGTPAMRALQPAMPLGSSYESSYLRR